ncbi:MAG: hypothetical protein J0M04_17520 [Verrucomicrobia bacterium]|nr:hypothetical protein [Verrucomicrobiota bacterium]
MNSLHEILDVTHLNFRVRFSILRGDELRLLLIAVCTYLMIAILHKQIKLPGTLHRTLQILSVHPFEKVTLNKGICPVGGVCPVTAVDERIMG